MIIFRDMGKNMTDSKDEGWHRTGARNCCLYIINNVEIFDFLNSMHQKRTQSSIDKRAEGLIRYFTKQNKQKKIKWAKAYTINYIGHQRSVNSNHNKVQQHYG